jgi:hypothetical protein
MVFYVFGKHRNLCVIHFRARFPFHQIPDQHLGAVMLDLRLVHDVFLDLLVPAGRVEDLLLEQGMHDQLVANLFDQLLLHAVRPRLFEPGEQALHLAVVGLQHGDRIRARGRTAGRFTRLFTRGFPRRVLRWHGRVPPPKRLRVFCCLDAYAGSGDPPHGSSD